MKIFLGLFLLVANAVEVRQHDGHTVLRYPFMVNTAKLATEIYSSTGYKLVKAKPADTVHGHINSTWAKIKTIDENGKEGSTTVEWTDVLLFQRLGATDDVLVVKATGKEPQPGDFSEKEWRSVEKGSVTVTQSVIDAISALAEVNRVGL